MVRISQLTYYINDINYVIFSEEILQPSSQIASRPLSSVFHVDPDECDLVNTSFPAGLSPPTGIMLNSGYMIHITILFIDADIRAIGSSSVIPTASGRQ